MSQIGLNTNLAAMRAQRRLTENSASLKRTFERLASGLRINRASDDAAGLSIAQGLNTDARVFSQGVRNLNDGVGLLNVADGALEQLSTIVIRMRELATQSANGTISSTQRKALDEEAQELSKEYTRIVRSTRFNGQLLFDQAFGSLRLQAGYGANGAIASALGGLVGNGDFTSSYSGGPGTNVADGAIGDFNRDGIQDIITVAESSSSIHVALGNGDGTFQAYSTITSGGSTHSSVAINDFNGDGNADIVATYNSDRAIGIFLGNGDGTFQSSLNASVGTNPTELFVGDFNGDGHQDVATADTGTTAISVLLGNGNGTFQSRLTHDLGVGNNPLDVEGGDFNGDGILDLVYTAGGEVFIAHGSGDGTFTTATSMDPGVIPEKLVVGDFNGDGLDDIVSSSPNDGQNFTLFLNRGNSQFSSFLDPSAGSAPYRMAAGDVNGDGILDLVHGDQDGGLVGIHIGNGDGTFDPVVALDSGGSVIGNVGLTDFNGDGVLDILAIDLDNDAAITLLGDTTSGTAPLLPIDLTQRYRALDAIATLDRALDRVSLQRGVIGAFLSRIDTGINNLTQATENFESAKSRITDSDVATEAAELTKFQILQQASSAILSQANLEPQLALLLLQS